MRRSPLVLVLLTAAMAVGQETSRELLKAADKGDLDKVNSLIKQGANVASKDSEGKTAVYYSVRGRHVAVTERLLELGAPEDLPDHSGVTPLMIASGAGNVELIRLLLTRGARVDGPPGETKVTPLSVASEKREYEAVGMLLKAGAKVEISRGFVHPDYPARSGP